MYVGWTIQPSAVFIHRVANRFPHVIPAKEAVSQFVVPAKPRKTGREAGSRIAWIPDLTTFVRNDA